MAYNTLEIVVSEWKSLNSIVKSVATYEIEQLLTNGMEL